MYDRRPRLHRAQVTAARATVVLGSCVVLSSCFTNMMWDDVWRDMGAVLHTENLEIVSLTPGEAGVVTLETSQGRWPTGRFRLVSKGGAPQWVHLARSRGLTVFSMNLQMPDWDGGVGVGTLVLRGEALDCARPIQDAPRSQREVRLESRSGIRLKGKTWWHRAHGYGKPAPRHFRAVAWLRRGRASVDDEEVWWALGTRERIPDLATLAEYELCIEARETDRARPAWFAVRADALWLEQWTDLRAWRSMDQLVWSYETTWAVTAVAASAPGDPIKPRDVGQSKVKITWHERRSPLMLRILGVAAATPFTLAFDFAIAPVIGIYVLISLPFTDWEGPI